MEQHEKEFLAYAAISNRTIKGIEEGIAFIVDQAECSREEALDMISLLLKKRICKERNIS